MAEDLTKVRLYYKGDVAAGEYHVGIPARDLDGEDMHNLGDEGRKVVDASPFYQKTQPAAASRKDDS